MRCIDHHHHANAIVEGAVHLEVIDACCALEPGKQFGLWPTAFAQVGCQTIGQHTGNVFKQSTPCDVRQSLDGLS